jgi:hypothetical protein
MYSKGDVAVSLRLLRALGDIAMTTPDKIFREALLERGKRIVEGCAEKLGQEELGSLRARLVALEKLTAVANGEGPEVETNNQSR